MKKENFLLFAWIIALCAMMGSLFFSEVMKFPPCVLCWYQRICMYPLVAILPIGMMKKDKTLPYYVLALSGVGAVISVYHNLLYYKILPESLQPCINGVSCTTKFIEYFGFVTIPFLSLTAFLVIIVSMVLYLKSNKEKTS